MEEIRGIVLWLVFISTFGIVPVFVILGFQEFWILRTVGNGTSTYCFVLVILTLFLWALYLYVEHKACEKVQNNEKLWEATYELRTVAFFILLAYTLLGFFFFVRIVPRIR